VSVRKIAKPRVPIQQIGDLFVGRAASTLMLAVPSASLPSCPSAGQGANLRPNRRRKSKNGIVWIVDLHLLLLNGIALDASPSWRSSKRVIT
jgi:hypothetical protein